MPQNQKPIRNEIRDDELDAFFQKHGHDDPTKPWETDEWQQNREEILADACAWCGDTDDLRIHTTQTRPEWWEVWDRTRNDLFEDSDYYRPHRYTETLDVCPQCKRQSFYERTTKQPQFRCQKCHHEFDDPDQRPVRDQSQDAYWQDLTTFVQHHHHQITEAFQQRYDNYWDDYFSLENTITLCQKCQYAYREHNQKICAHCGNSYADYRPEFNDHVCWDCVVDAKGLKKCPDCGERWFNPQYNDACKQCRGGWFTL